MDDGEDDGDMPGGEEFAQIRQLLQSNPQMLPVLLNQLAQSHPEVPHGAEKALCVQGCVSMGVGEGGGDASTTASNYRELTRLLFLGCS